MAFSVFFYIFPLLCNILCFIIVYYLNFAEKPAIGSFIASYSFNITTKKGQNVINELEPFIYSPTTIEMFRSFMAETLKQLTLKP